MAQLSITFCRKLARARRERGMTQSALAQAVSCAQSAISMLESGQPGKLSQETVGKIASLLGVPLEDSAPDGVPLPTRPSAGYCPNAACFSNIPYVVADEVLFWPRPQPTAARGPYCVYCGEVLEPQCPHCGAGVTPGACCPQCGRARITGGAPDGVDPEDWAARRRRELADWRALSAWTGFASE
ncbi:MAG TPA: helix-turn-helix transcriptional regulator [Kiritimatiellia bacterium]|jgi:transcriptional regulator with XRE-family HTH domain|nr:helix-turn-helix transcriptional regulator [Kiritimatiellia bacterium]HOM59221.1 helix-turn-helix transcriptional regulator [Kiritimatiellia bacterium]HOR97181.1 helix-turn-helix transcriptional regulator [Kiritimatiellia bacterium]HPC48932.1 helix-turn-helix transcriptional regulator [Kiritimatiellia bacterium]HPK36699.1 helix-turn-helix transcriptional regulator [Kiritimatiellia bacterium]